MIENKEHILFFAILTIIILIINFIRLKQTKKHYKVKYDVEKELNRMDIDELIERNNSRFDKRRKDREK